MTEKIVFCGRDFEIAQVLDEPRPGFVVRHRQKGLEILIQCEEEAITASAGTESDGKNRIRTHTSMGHAELTVYERW